MLKTSLDDKIAEWETAERDVPEASVSVSDAPKFMAFGNNHVLFNADADGLKSNAGRYHDSSVARTQRAIAHSAANRMQWILLSLLSGTALSACGGGGGGGGGAPVVTKPNPLLDVTVKKDPEPDPLPVVLIKATPEPVKKDTSEAGAEGEDREIPDQKPTGLAFATPRGTVRETVSGTYTEAAGRKLSDINITDDDKGVNRVFLKKVESHRYFEVKKNPITGTWELWLKGNKSLPDPKAITAEIGIKSDGFGNVAGVSARYILTVENTPEAPTVEPEPPTKEEQFRRQHPARQPAWAPPESVLQRMMKMVMRFPLPLNARMRQVSGLQRQGLRCGVMNYGSKQGRPLILTMPIIATEL